MGMPIFSDPAMIRHHFNGECKVNTYLGETMNKQYRAQFSVTDIDSSLWWFTMKNHDWFYRWIRWYPMLFSDTLLYWSVKKSHLKVSRFWRLFRKFLFPPKQCCFSHVIHALPGKQLELPPIEHSAGPVLGVGFHWNIRCFAGHLCSHRCTCALAFGSCSAERTGENMTFGIPIKRMHQESTSFSWVLQVLPQRTWGVAYRARCWWQISNQIRL